MLGSVGKETKDISKSEVNKSWHEVQLNQKHPDSIHLSPVTQASPGETQSPSVTVVPFPSVIVVAVEILIHIKLIIRI